MPILDQYCPDPDRYDGRMPQRRCGDSGVTLPEISLGFWHNFGDTTPIATQRAIMRAAFDAGVTHFDLANNYGPPYGSAETNVGRILREDFSGLRDELIISTKAGYYMWPGPYGEWGSRKYLIASLDQSLKRMGLDYVDIFYSHRPDPNTPLEETMMALDYAVRSGRALYAGISTYSPEQSRQAAAILRDLGTPCLIHQPAFSMFNRWIEEGLLDVLGDEGIGCIAFSPLAQGLLTSKYLGGGIPTDSRAAKPHGALKAGEVSSKRVDMVRRLNQLAEGRGQTMAQLAIAWVLRHPQMTSALIGASKVSQVEDCAAAVRNISFTDDELASIEAILHDDDEPPVW